MISIAEKAEVVAVLDAAYSISEASKQPVPIVLQAMEMNQRLKRQMNYDELVETLMTTLDKIWNDRPGESPTGQKGFEA